MTSIAIPLRVRVIAYILTLLPLDGLAAWLVSDQHLSTSAAALIGLILGAIHTTTGVFALAHLSIPDGSSDTAMSDAAAAISAPLAQVDYTASLPGYTAQSEPAAASAEVAAALSDPAVPPATA